MTTPAQISRANVPAYQYLTPSVPEMAALGIQSPIVLAEQLVINDRLHPDRYMVTTITGLRGSDIRDNRIPHPSSSGEIPYDAFYSGRTISVEGYIEAGNINSLGRMEKDLMAVLGPLPAAALGNYYSQSISVEYLTALQALPEFPIRFNWWDQHDAFYDTSSSAFWGTLSGSALSIPGTGRCTTASGGSTLSYHNLRSGFIDEIVTAMVSVTPTGSANSIGVVSSCTSSTSYIQAVVTWNGSSTWTLNLQAVTASGTTTLASASITAPTAQTTWWIQLQGISDTFTANLYAVDPRANQSATALATASATLTGAMAQTFGYGTSGFTGLTATSTAHWCFLDWRVDSIWPCDFIVGGRLIQSPAMGHTSQKDSTRFQRPFQFSVRASDPRILAANRTTLSVPVISSPNVGLGRIYTETYTKYYQVPVSEPTGMILSETVTSDQKINAYNHGSWVARPLIKIYGGITSPILTNLTNGQQLILDGTIATTDYLVIDCNLNTIVNSTGANQFSLFDPSSDWLLLGPGDNLLQLVGQATAGSSPNATVTFQGAWM